MNITVLNGSPKGELSVTMQYVAYLAKVFPHHHFNILPVAQKIKRLEKDEGAFAEIIEQVRSADAVLWGFPLYILHVHANYKRFIELVFERGAQGAFAGKYTAAISTSINFFDHTAHNYMQGICDDLGMRYVDFHSPDMHALMEEEGCQRLVQFGRLFFHAVEQQIPTQRRTAPLHPREFTYQPQNPVEPVSAGDKKVVILHDENDPDSSLFRMVQRCQQSLAGDVQVFNIHDLDIKGSCLGCLACSSNYECAYNGKDSYTAFYQNQVMKADILVYAGRMVDRYWSARWKMFFDRIFFNTHTPVLQEKQIVLVTSGPFSQEPNLMEIFRGFFEFQGANLCAVVTDEYGDSAEIERRLDHAMTHALRSARMGYMHPQSFLGRGGMMIFRDDIYGRLRTVFMADHRAYRKLGLYRTYPQNQLSTILLNTFAAPLVNLPPVRKKFDAMIKEQMVQGHKNVVAKAEEL